MACDDLPTCVYASVMIGITWLCLLPFCIFCVHQFYAYRVHPGINIRSAPRVLFIAGTCIAHMMFVETFYYLQIGIGVDILQKPGIVWAGNIFSPTIILLLCECITFRFWNTHFFIKYAIEISKDGWRNILCDAASKPHRNWYSLHIHDYGNVRHALRYFIAHFIAAAVIMVTVTTLEHPSLVGFKHYISALVYLLCYSPLIVLCITIIVLTPTLALDAFFVRKEMNYLAAVYVAACVLYAVSLALDQLIMMQNSRHHSMWLTINTTAMTIFTCGGTIVSTKVIWNRISTRDSNMERYRRSPPSCCCRSRAVHGHGRDGTTPMSAVEYFRSWNAFDGDIASGKLQPKNGVQNIGSISSKTLFQIIISNEVGINLFFLHLQSEFALENLLAYIECMQFIHSLITGDNNLAGLRCVQGLSFDISESVPLSSVNAAYTRSDDDDYSQAFAFMFRKYIHPSAEYQVNLPYETATLFANLQNLLDIKQQVGNGTYKYKYPRPELRSQPDTLTLLTSDGQDNDEDGMETSIRQPVLSPLSAISEHKELRFVSPEDDEDAKEEEKAFMVPVHANTERTLSVVDPVAKASVVSVASELLVVEHLTIMNGWQMQRSQSEPKQLPHLRDAPTLSSCASVVKTKESFTDIVKEKFDKFIRKTTSIHSNRSLGSKKTKYEPAAATDEQEALNALYLNEHKRVADASKVGKKEVIEILCSVINETLQLNYQSVTRFKQTKTFQRFVQSVEFDSLLKQYQAKYTQLRPDM